MQVFQRQSSANLKPLKLTTLKPLKQKSVLIVENLNIFNHELLNLGTSWSPNLQWGHFPLCTHTNVHHLGYSDELTLAFNKKTFLFWFGWGTIFDGTLQGTNISPKNGILKMIFLFPYVGSLEGNNCGQKLHVRHPATPSLSRPRPLLVHRPTVPKERSLPVEGSSLEIWYGKQATVVIEDVYWSILVL